MADTSQYWLPRFLFQRGLGFLYLLAFLIAINQFRPLLSQKPGTGYAITDFRLPKSVIA